VALRGVEHFEHIIVAGSSRFDDCTDFGRAVVGISIFFKSTPLPSQVLVLQQRFWWPIEYEF
jgi:hypothetical protein